MYLSRRGILGAAASSVLPLSGAWAEGAPVRIGVLSDLSGPYRDSSGPVVTQCVQQAVAEMASALSYPVEVISADHLNKVDVGLSVVRKWFDQDGIDAIVDVNNSAVALAATDLVRERDKVHLNNGAATSELTSARCNANTVSWTYDTWEQAHSTCCALSKMGGDSWFLLTADYTFGHSLENESRSFIEAAGGRVVGSSRYPFGTSDFSAFLLQAQTSGAKVLGLCNAGGETMECIKQAVEFGLPRQGMRTGAMFLFINGVRALGLPTAQGTVLTATFYWDLNERTRAFTKRVLPRTGGPYPNMQQAGAYSAVLHYLKAVKEVGPAIAKASGREVVAAMKRIPTDDDAFGPGLVRQDGPKLTPAYLFEVKKPEESKADWDYYRLLATTPAKEAFRPLKNGHCSLVKA